MAEPDVHALTADNPYVKLRFQPGSRRTKRAFTLFEMMIALGATVALLMAAAGFYSFVIVRTATDTTRAAVVMQANALADEITRHLQNAVDCGPGNAGDNDDIQIIMPRLGTDRDGDGYDDTFTIDWADTSGNERVNEGDYVWFYMSDSSGESSKKGDYIWRARCVDDKKARADDADFKWSKRGATRRWNLIDDLDFSIDYTNRSTTFSIRASSLNRAERSAEGLNDRMSYMTTITRTVFWRNAR